MWRLLLIASLLPGCARGLWQTPGPRADGGSMGDAAGERAAPAVGAGALPVVTAFSATSAAGTTQLATGEPVKISWTVEDAEGLAAAPVELALTTDGNTWQTVVQRFGTLSGNPKQWSGSYSELKAPGSGFLRLRIIAWDAAGQGSLPVLSDALNAGSWNVYAGSSDRGLGSSGRAVALRYSANPTIIFALSPVTGDLFAIDDRTGVVRLDAKTGLTSRFIGTGPSNLPDDGPLPASPTLDALDSIVMDQQGLLYLTTATFDTPRRMAVYQLDLARGRVRRYLGGGSVFDATATPSTVASTWGPIAFDEENSLYFLATCSPDGWTDSSTVRLMKATQSPDGTAGTVSIVAGSCVKGAPPASGPVDAKSASLGTSYWINAAGSIAVWNRGEAIYLGLFSTPVSKIIKGQLYATAIVMAAESVLLYDAKRDRLLAADGAIREVTPSLTGPKGETSVVRAGGAAAAPGCDADGLTATQACLLARRTLQLAPDGRLLFVDGVSENSDTGYRVRSVENDGRIRTLLGSRPFVGEGLDRRVVRGYPAGLALKRPDGPNQGSFGAGLYLMEHGGPTLLRIDGDGKTRTVWGSQVVDETVHPTGTPVGPALSLGRTYFGGDGRPIALDDGGLPWVRYNGVLARADAAGKLVQLQDRSLSDCWSTAPDGADPGKYGMAPYGARSNLAIKGGGAFLIGAGCAPYNSIRYFDFASHQVTRLIGGSPDGSSPDSAVPGSVRNLKLPAACVDDCYLVYRAVEDRLYFSEENKLRFITAPTDPASSTLKTFLTSGDRIRSFIFSPDGHQLFYVEGGHLHCHDLGSGKAWCNHLSLGPPPELGTIGSVPNQLAFEDAGRLLVSTGSGEVLRFTLPP